ncbi:MAG: cobalamin biosynthesis protein [Pararhodobacter sp.]
MIVAGFGFRALAGAGSLHAALEAALAETHQPEDALVALASAEDKIAALHPLAERLRLRLIALSPAALQAEDTPTRSAASLAARGTGSLAEAAALAGARRLAGAARLLAPRVVSPDRMASCALAFFPSVQGVSR